MTPLNASHRRLSHILVALSILLASACARDNTVLVTDVSSSDGVDATGGVDATVDLYEPPTEFSYQVPLDPQSPWPKFRRNALQNGRSPVRPQDSGRAPWQFQTGKGIFSTPVIGGDGTVYIGSADRIFYAIDKLGNKLWEKLTGEIIDSSALLDKNGRVIFGSGDGTLYLLDRADPTNDPKTFQADLASETGGLINWFEGNVAIGPDGTLLVPNDNFRTYAIDPDSLTVKWFHKTPDQTWSLPAVDPTTNLIYIGNNFLLGGRNVFCIDGSDGTKKWDAASKGSVAASPMLTGTGPGSMVVVGSFDGFVYAFDSQSGEQKWSFGTRDHVYASPAQLSDGTIIQASADGTVYALDPTNGALRWAFDTQDPIRSSPAVDGDDNVYVAGGDGRLYVLKKDGTLRWSIQLIDEPRNDLNASVALGREQIVVAGENGRIFSLPYDLCLRPVANRDARCRTATGETLPSDAVELLFTTNFGAFLAEPPSEIEANQPLGFSLFLRENGDTRLAGLDSASLTVTITPANDARIDISGDRRFVTIIPRGRWVGPTGGTLTVTIKGNYLVDFERDGLAFSGGTVGGTFDKTFTFDVPATNDSGSLTVPSEIGKTGQTFELSRLAAPLPAILPSFNQIGFDSIHYLIGLVEGDGTKAIAWGIGGTLEGVENKTVVDPGSRVRFPLEVEYDGGLLTMQNEQGFTIEFNAFLIPFAYFRVASRFDASTNGWKRPQLNTYAICGDISFYGPFLRQLGYCNPQTDVLNVIGAAELREYTLPSPPALSELGTVTIEVVGSKV
ncbi:MAG: PQQ-binding-like beta-propeller repeat protein, partial [Myxococcales bacterium]|nr:PQQ-binding-like beta-propeller repeat protein [Myxococcales bacterium]